MVNYAKILSILAIILVIGIVFTITLSLATIGGANADLLISEYQMVVTALGLSAIALALLKLSYRKDG